MSSLAEIEKAVEALPLEQKRKLMLFLGASLHEASAHEPRKLSPAERADDFRTLGGQP